MVERHTAFQRPLILDFLEVTKPAAIAAYPWVGKYNKVEADRAATEALRHQLNMINIDGKIVIGEGEMDDAPMLYIGEKVGTGFGPKIDIAVDPIEGTTLNCLWTKQCLNGNRCWRSKNLITCTGYVHEENSSWFESQRVHRFGCITIG